ncbi:hypothetical protein PR202_ga30571 [Eleusine coracana subsp. coracana]|uniref:BHLH domain-containing protein n=1 Tax=Eleusine coracana subsp. coracana TaxID=191504 RepID=A0AAV5DPM5_ELECO|nr:hypothetical protein PR202_ga30571 [Eleusine coracana subsp. coracana]
MIHAAAAAATGTTSRGHSVDWWSTAVTCSPDHQLPAGWSGPADGNSSRSGNAASSESPGSNSFATGVSSVTFQESAGVPGPAAVVPQPVAGTFTTDWSHPYYFDGSGFLGHMSSRNDQGHMNVLSLTSPSSNNSPMMPQDPHEQNHQFLSNLGLELLSSPTSPSPGFRSLLLKSLTEPAASAKPLSGFQQYQQQTMNQVPADSIREALQFSNSTLFWNPSPGFGSVEGLANLGAARQSLGQSRLASSRADKSTSEGAGDSSSVIAKKVTPDRTALKKARTGTPSPLPTFKVRKEKLGDRITALQQLVSPFGKTDTASVLHETIEYIKFLHEQVGSLSAPYLKNRQQVPHLKIVSRDGSEAAATKGDLTGRGLCLVPISSTFAVASETPVDFWTPFGAAFR